MKTNKYAKHLLIAAAVSGALAGLPLSAHASTGTPSPDSGPTTEKQGCGGKEGCGGKTKEKASCAGKEQKSQKPTKEKGGDKVACAGKDGCGGKDMRK